MVAIVTVLLTLPVGYLVRSRSAAMTVYAVAYLWAFTYQTLYLLLGSAEAADPAFVPGEFPLSYGVVTLGVLGVGLVLVEAGHRLAARRRARAEVAVA